MTEVHLVVVHYQCENEIRRSLQSVQEDLAGARSISSLTAWVIDNGTSPGKALNSPPLPLDPRIITPPENLGFGRGCNLALEKINSGVVVFLNPDTSILPGTLDALVAPLEDESVGGVGPRIFLDDGCQYTVSEPLDLDLRLAIRAGIKDRFPSLGMERREVIKRQEYADCSHPGPTRMLCGAGMAIPRRVLNEAGLFHPGYFMYFEDLDLVREIRRAGYRIIHNPEARIIHYYDRSARQVGSAKEGWVTASYETYLARQFSPWRRRLAALTSRCLEKFPLAKRERKIVQAENAPWRLSTTTPLAGPGPWFFEFSEGRNYDITAGTWIKSSPWVIPKEIWSDLVPKTYWTRLSTRGAKGPILHGEMLRQPD